MNRLTAVTVLTAASIAFAAPAFATKGHDKPAVCHPKAGGWTLISPDKASSHIDEVTGLPKHEHQGRVDVYATNGSCPPITPTPTATGGTPSATLTPSSTTTSPSSSTTSSSTTSAPPSSSSTSPPSPSQTSSTPTPTAPTTSTTSPSVEAPITRPSHPSSGSSNSSPSATSTTKPSPASPRRNAPSSTVAPPEHLAYTGGELSDAAYVALFLLFVGAILGGFGWLLSRKPKPADPTETDGEDQS